MDKQRALTHYQRAAELLEAAKAEFEVIYQEGDNRIKWDAKSFMNQVGELLSSDHDEAGLQPFIRQLNRKR